MLRNFLGIFLLILTISCSLPEEEFEYSSFGLSDSSIQSLDLKVLCYEAPKGLNTQNLSISGHKTETCIIASKSGLYRHNGKKFDHLAKNASTALSLWRKDSFVFAQNKEIKVLKTEVFNPLINSFSNPIIKLFYEDEATIWAITTESIYFIKNDNSNPKATISSFKDFGTITEATSAKASNFLLIQNKNKDFYLFNKKDFNRIKLEKGSMTFQSIITGPENQVFALSEGHLYFLQADTNELNWLPFKLGSQNLKLSFLVNDPLTGRIWANSDNKLINFDLQSAFISDLPKDITKVEFLNISFDGSLWIFDGQKLFNLRNKEENITYKEHISPFIENNCIRCHSSLGGTSFSLESLDNAKKRAQDMVSAIESGQMPPDKKALKGGDQNLIKKWIQGGYRP